jgi:glycerophosphoryl diester phosphodiesterase
MTLPALTIVAHRGASALAPENTLAAFTAALELGVEVIESDIRLTRDGALILAHDDNLTRLTGREERIADLDLATLQTITVGRDRHGTAQHFATPAELLRLVAGRARILFDMKISPDEAAELLPLLRAMGAEREVIIGVRSVAALGAIKAAAPEIATLAFGRTLAEVWALIEVGADIMRLWSPWVSDETLSRARHLDRQVWVMCGSPAQGDAGETAIPTLLDYRQRGIDAVILNDPRLALAANQRSAVAR